MSLPPEISLANNISIQVENTSNWGNPRETFVFYSNNKLFTKKISRKDSTLLFVCCRLLYLTKEKHLDN